MPNCLDCTTLPLFGGAVGGAPFVVAVRVHGLRLVSSSKSTGTGMVFLVCR